MKKLWCLCLLAAACGGLIGCAFPFAVPSAYSKLYSVAILMGLESVFSGIKLILRGKFRGRYFLLNFAAGIVIAVAFVFAGDSLGLDLYYVSLLAVGFRLLQNLDILKIHLFTKMD